MPLPGLGVEGTNTVAPAMLCIAPSAPKVVAAAFSTALTGDEATATSAAEATTRTTGVRWSKAMSRAPGRLSQCRRRRRAEESFIGDTET